MAHVGRLRHPVIYGNVDREEEYDSDYKMTVAERVIWFVAGVIISLLALRFLFALLGANPTNAIANFIYTVSHPFVAPFFNLFNYNYINGSSRFEVYTLVAIVIYALIAAGLSRLVTLGRHYE
jgi:YggT family protein